MPCSCVSGVCSLFGQGPAKRPRERPSTAARPREPLSEEDSALLDLIARHSILELLGEGGGGGRRCSLSTEKDLGNRTSFKAKPLREEGAVAGPTTAVGLTCRKGLIPESPNQDSAMLMRVEGDVSLYGVFDGRGSEGHEVSDFVKDALPKLVVRDARFKECRREMAGILRDAFAKTQALVSALERAERLSAGTSGTTATLAVHDHKSGRLTVANVSDSLCILSKGPGAYGDCTAVQLTPDHDCAERRERERVVAAGGRVVFDGYANNRIYVKDGRHPGLTKARSLGDTLSRDSCGIIAEPAIQELDLQENDQALILGSRGFWEFVTPDQAAMEVGLYEAEEAKATVDKLAKRAWDIWMMEEGGAYVADITVMVVGLRDPPHP